MKRQVSSLKRQGENGKNGVSRRAPEQGKNYSCKRSVATAFLQHLCPKMHLGLIAGGMRWAANGVPQTSISPVFLKGHQMWRAEAGEGYIEGTIFAAAAVITSVALHKLLSPLPVTKTVTRKHTARQRGGKAGASIFVANTQEWFTETDLKVRRNLALPVALRRGSRLWETKQRDDRRVKHLNSPVHLSFYKCTLNYQPLGPSHIFMHTLSSVLLGPLALELCRTQMLITLERLPD